MYNEIKIRYIDKGLKIFPVIKNAKTPMIENWQNDCSCDRLQILYWLENSKGCNWGLPCSPNNLFVLDIDVHNVNGIESVRRLFHDLGLTNEIHTLVQKTPSGGLHFIFKSDDELKNVANTSNSFKDYPGIDIRTDGYILCVPSEINGKKYEMPYDYEIKEMPDVLKTFILSQKDIIKIPTSERKEYVKPDKVDEGNRDNELFLYINNLYFKTRLDKNEITLLATYFNENICSVPLPKRQVTYKINKVFKKDRGKCMFIRLDKLDEVENYEME